MFCGKAMWIGLSSVGKVAFVGKDWLARCTRNWLGCGVCVFLLLALVTSHIGEKFGVGGRIPG